MHDGTGYCNVLFARVVPTLTNHDGSRHNKVISTHEWRRVTLGCLLFHRIVSWKLSSYTSIRVALLLHLETKTKGGGKCNLKWNGNTGCVASGNDDDSFIPDRFLLVTGFWFSLTGDFYFSNGMGVNPWLAASYVFFFVSRVNLLSEIYDARPRISKCKRCRNDPFSV